MEPNEKDELTASGTPEEQNETPEEQNETPEETAEPAEEAEETGEASGEETVIDKKQLFNDIVEIAETVLFTTFMILLIFSYLLRPVTVDGSSMYPTLRDGDRLVMYRLCYTPKQGDIVVVSDYEGHVLAPDGRVVSSGISLNECIIKRVIAVGGQEINIDTAEAKVTVDGVALSEPYINAPTLTNDGAFTYPMTVPEGYIFVMGDNRNHSTDSRSVAVGLVEEEDVLGTAFFRYYLGKDEATDRDGHSVGFVK